MSEEQSEAHQIRVNKPQQKPEKPKKAPTGLNGAQKVILFLGLLCFAVVGVIGADTGRLASSEAAAVLILWVVIIVVTGGLMVLCKPKAP